MKPSVAQSPVTGSIQDVAGFFHVTDRTVQRWMASGTIGYWNMNGTVVFGEDDVAQYYARYYRPATADKMPDAEAKGRELWKAHLRELNNWKAVGDRIVKRLDDHEATIQQFLNERRAQAIAQRIGCRLNLTPQIGGIRMDSLTQQEKSDLLQAQPLQWEFTNLTTGITFYVPAGASDAEILSRAAQKEAA